MIRKSAVLFLITILIYSCSTDKDNEGETNSIVGTWDVTELRIDESTASDDAKNARDLLDFLNAIDCSILTNVFSENLSLVTQNKGNYLEINVNEEGTGLDVVCPTQMDTETTTYTYADGVLTVTDENSETVTINVAISGDTMTIDAAELDIPNFNDGGELVFKRR